MKIIASICSVIFVFLEVLWGGTAFGATIAYQRPEYISIVGPIVAGDYDRFVSAIMSTKAPIIDVMVVSPGGNVQEAIKIGRLIRRLNLGTEAPFTNEMNAVVRAQSCSRASRLDAKVQCMCASACTLIWFAGAGRIGNDLLIHSIRYNDDYYSHLTPGEAATQYRVGEKEIREYLEEMDVPDGVYQEMFRMPSSLITPLSMQQFLSIGTFPPGYNEWLDSRCRQYAFGSEDHAKCAGKEARLAAITAVSAFRRNGH